VNPHEVISAQVVFKGAGGRVPTSDAAITSATLDAYIPDEDAVNQASTLLRDLGFDVGKLAGNSFAITAPVTTFERAFKTAIEDTPSKGARFRAKRGGKSLELTGRSIPTTLRKSVHAITFTAPPDFGPQQFSQ
jgi:hypothetical protein